MTKEIALQHGVKVHVIDVGKENAIHRTLQEEVRKLRVFPTLVTSSGKRLEGDITKSQIESVLSQAWLTHASRFDLAL